MTAGAATEAPWDDLSAEELGAKFLKYAASTVQCATRFEQSEPRGAEEKAATTAKIAARSEEIFASVAARRPDVLQVPGVAAALARARQRIRAVVQRAEIKARAQAMQRLAIRQTGRRHCLTVEVRHVRRAAGRCSRTAASDGDPAGPAHSSVNAALISRRSGFARSGFFVPVTMR